jgi:metal-responsive CopG/Arc/MetJ family transcriptional regulator
MKMVRKTVSLDDELYRELEKEGVLAHFKNFSDLVSSSLKQTISEMKKQNYARQIAEMANDPLVQEDFKYADGEIDAF